MIDITGTPSATHVIRVLARREIALGLKRRLLKLLFLGSVLPPLILVVIIAVRLMAERSTGFELGWDPLVNFLAFQSLPVTLLALGLGTPSVARDRAEDVLFLYATRPLQPWHYAMGKLLAVAIPTAALMMLPGLLIPLLRFSVTADLGGGAALAMAGRLVLMSLAMGWALAGVCVGASSVVRKGRWALVLALTLLFLPDGIMEIFPALRDWPLGPIELTGAAVERFFGNGDTPALWSIALLSLWGAVGFWISLLRVRREMIP